MPKRIVVNLRNISPLRYWKELLGILIILLAFVFFRDQRKEIEQIMPLLQNCNIYWVIAGVLLTLFFILMEGYMYVASFRAMSLKISIKVALELFLKRNLLSVFLPAGGISSLAYNTTQLRRMNLNKTQIHQTSILYGYLALFSVFLLAIPILLYSLWKSDQVGNLLVPFLILALILAVSFYIFYCIRYKTRLYQLLESRFPNTVTQISNLFSSEVDKSHLFLSLFFRYWSNFVASSIF